jgi:hypothetical protein
MPGPVSDSYDSEFGTGSNACDVRDAIRKIIDKKITKKLGPNLKNIVEIVHSNDKKTIVKMPMTEKEMRIVRFALNRALESI